MKYKYISLVINDLEEFIKTQKKLFVIGFKWADGSNDFLYLNSAANILIDVNSLLMVYDDTPEENFFKSQNDYIIMYEKNEFFKRSYNLMMDRKNKDIYENS